MDRSGLLICWLGKPFTGQPSSRLVALWSLLAVYLITLAYPGLGLPADKPFNNPSNGGGTGLLEMPNARTLYDGELRWGFAAADPYYWYVLGIGILPRLEFNLRYTEINDMPTDLPDFGDYKDKAFDIKFKLIEESRRFPAVAIGLQDQEGTELFASRYLAVSRQIYPFDITLGIGSGRLNGGNLSFSDEISFFAGLELAIHDRLTAVLEYNSIDYAIDPAPIRAIPEGAGSPFNFGLRMKITPAFSLGLSYQRGDTLGLMTHLTFALGKPLLPKRPDPPDWRFLIVDPDRRLTPRQAAEGALEDLIKTDKFRNIRVWMQGDTLVAELENARYPSNVMAAGRVFRILLNYASLDTRTLMVRLSRRGVPILSASVTPDHLHRYLTGRMHMDVFKELVKVVPATPQPTAAQDAVALQPPSLIADAGVKPQVINLFDQTSAELQSRISLLTEATIEPWKGNAIVGSLDIPLFSNVDAETELPDKPVRSDSWKYLKGDAAITQLMDDQVVKLSSRLYGRLSTGYLERMYAGVSTELLTFFGDGRFAAGIGADWVKKREPGTLLDLQDFDSYTALGNFYYFYNPLNLTLQTQAGRFLAGDTGLRFQLTRRYDTGAQVGFWYSLTDTDDLTLFNRGYNDKGVFIQMPMDIFFNYQTRNKFTYAISPWTRDVGATVHHWQDLYDFAGDLTPARFKAELTEFNK
jgi:hypothetical protein